MKAKRRIRVIAITVLGVLGTVFVNALARRETPKAATITDLNSTKPLKRRLQQDAVKGNSDRAGLSRLPTLSPRIH
jgi:hypothetical protein